MAAKSTLSKVDVLFCDRLYNNSMYVRFWWDAEF